MSSVYDTGRLRIVSLIPSATEIVAALGLTDFLVGRSHECDCPPGIKALPVCTAPKFNPEGSSVEIHDRVTKILQSALSVYSVNTELLETLQPTHVLTQAQCDVCAVSLSDVETAVATLIKGAPTVISLQPRLFDDLWDDIRRVAHALGVDGEPLIHWLNNRVSSCVEQINPIEGDRPTVACIEWIEPLMAAGNWVPELVELAGGVSCFGAVGEHSPWIEWRDLVVKDPDIIVAMPCGYGLVKTRQEMKTLIQKPEWKTLKAVKNKRVYITDGNQYFNRPGPRLIDSLELLSEIFYPDRVSYGYEAGGWKHL
ncbi:MAG: cobalamin-binding protein [Leptolyngbyaceae bacterium]|nr:cobalamin-binding protein [Leptolyngbyaceae bacterium]